RSDAGHSNRLPGHVGCGPDFLLDEFHVVDDDSKGRACSAHQSHRSRIPRRRSTGTGSVLFGPGQQFSTRSIPEFHKYGFSPVEDEPVCRDPVAASWLRGAQQCVAGRDSDLGNPGDILRVVDDCKPVAGTSTAATRKRVVMTGGQESIETLLRQVRSRRRLALLVDYLVVASSAGLFLLSITVFVSRITGRPSILSLAPAAFFARLLTFLARRWSGRRGSDFDSAFLIDRKLELEDRFTTACSVIRDGRSDCVFEEALLEDTAGKIVEARAESLAPYRLKKWHAVAVCSLAILAAAWATPVRTTESLRDAEAQRTDIQAAGERLSQSAEQI